MMPETQAQERMAQEMINTARYNKSYASKIRKAEELPTNILIRKMLGLKDSLDEFTGDSIGSAVCAVLVSRGEEVIGKIIAELKRLASADNITNQSIHVWTLLRSLNEILERIVNTLMPEDSSSFS